MIYISQLIHKLMARHNGYYSYTDYFSLITHPVLFFILMLFYFLRFLWYINFYSKFEDLCFQMKLFRMLLPFFLLLLIHCLSNEEFCFCIPFLEKDSLHRAGGSPWGVGLLLLFLLFMISHQSSFHERWFPLVSRWLYF